MGRRIAILGGLLALAGCAAKAWVEHPMPRPPDRSCRTGGGAGHDVWVWECLDKQRVVISQYCGGLVGCKRALREAVACGQQTPLEKELGEYLGPKCPLPPAEQRWPGK